MTLANALVYVIDGATEGTIKVHRGRVMEKMGATSVEELVILAQRAGIATIPADATKV